MGSQIPSPPAHVSKSNVEAKSPPFKHQEAIEIWLIVIESWILIILCKNVRDTCVKSGV